VDVLALNRYLINLFKFQTMYFYTCTLCPNQSLGLPSSSGIFSASTEKSVRMSYNMNSFNKNELHRIWLQFFSVLQYMHIDCMNKCWRDWLTPIFLPEGTTFLWWSPQLLFYHDPHKQRMVSEITNRKIYVAVNFLFQLIYVFPLFKIH